MYATMIDPVEQPEMRVADMCALLLKTATEQRQRAYDTDNELFALREKFKLCTYQASVTSVQT